MARRANRVRTGGRNSDRGIQSSFMLEPQRAAATDISGYRPVISPFK
jgi:hypothetical protein